MLILMRGWQGSGKSMLARHILKSHDLRSVIFATDDYWMDGDRYCFDPDRLPSAHLWNQERTRKHCEKYLSDYVIVDNTNIVIAEMVPYIDIGRETGHAVVQAIPGDVVLVRRFMTDGNEADRDFALAMIKHHASRNRHGVPEEAVLHAARRWEESSLPLFSFGLSNNKE